MFPPPYRFARIRLAGSTAGSPGFLCQIARTCSIQPVFSSLCFVEYNVHCFHMDTRNVHLWSVSACSESTQIIYLCCLVHIFKMFWEHLRGWYVFHSSKIAANCMLQLKPCRCLFFFCNHFIYHLYQAVMEEYLISGQ